MGVLGEQAVTSGGTHPRVHPLEAHQHTLFSHLKCHSKQTEKAFEV